MHIATFIFPFPDVPGPYHDKEADNVISRDGRPESNADVDELDHGAGK